MKTWQSEYDEMLNKIDYLLENTQGIIKEYIQDLSKAFINEVKLNDKLEDKKEELEDRIYNLSGSHLMDGDNY